MKTLIGPADLAEHFNVKKSTVHKWVRQRRIPFYRVNGRLLRFDLEEVKQSVKA